MITYFDQYAYGFQNVENIIMTQIFTLMHCISSLGTSTNLYVHTIVPYCNTLFNSYCACCCNVAKAIGGLTKRVRRHVLYMLNGRKFGDCYNHQTW